MEFSNNELNNTIWDNFSELMVKISFSIASVLINSLIIILYQCRGKGLSDVLSRTVKIQSFSFLTVDCFLITFYLNNNDQNFNDIIQFYFRSFRTFFPLSFIKDDYFLNIIWIINITTFYFFLSLGICYSLFYHYQIIETFSNPISTSPKILFVRIINTLTVLLLSINLGIVFYFIKRYEIKENKEIFWNVGDQTIIWFIYLIILEVISSFTFYKISRSFIISKFSKKVSFIIKHLFVSVLVAFYIPFTNFKFINLVFPDDQKNGEDNGKPNFQYVVWLMSIDEIIFGLIHLFEFYKAKKKTQNFKLLSEKSSTIKEQCQNKKKDELLNDKSDINLVDASSDPFLSSPKVHFSSVISECFLFVTKGILHILENSTNNFVNVTRQHFNSVTFHFLIQQEYFNFRSTEEILSTLKKLRKKNFCTSQNVLIEYLPTLFNNIRIISGFTPEKLKESFKLEANFHNIENLENSEGKSGSIFFSTYDNKFFLKTIPERELNSLLHQLIEPYYYLLAEGNSTVLSRILGVYTIETGVTIVNLVLMENITPFSSDYLLYKFDLKGSLLKRHTKDVLMSRKTLKDLDFLDLKNKGSGLRIALKKEDISHLKESLQVDLKVLENAELMDYSFFIGITPNIPEVKEATDRYYISKDKKFCYFVGIIDYLTHYGRWKTMENMYLNFLHPKAKEKFSAVNPVLYRGRMMMFIFENVLEK